MLNDDAFYPRKETARDVLKCSVRTTYRLEKKGVLPPARYIGNKGGWTGKMLREAIANAPRRIK